MGFQEWSKVTSVLTCSCHPMRTAERLVEPQVRVRTFPQGSRSHPDSLWSPLVRVGFLSLATERVLTQKQGRRLREAGLGCRTLAHFPSHVPSGLSSLQAAVFAGPAPGVESRSSGHSGWGEISGLQTPRVKVFNGISGITVACLIGYYSSGIHFKL